MSFWKGRKVVVTGGAGLIGSHLCDLLIAAGSHVRVVDDFSKGTAQRLAHLDGKLELIVADLCVPGVAREVLAGQNTVMHLASRAFGIGYSADHHDEMYRFNCALNTQVLDACGALKLERVCVVSSSAVYSDEAPWPTPELPVNQGEPEQANRGYGQAKRQLEMDATRLAKECGTQVAILRPFNAYSERYKWEGAFSHVIPMLVKRVMDGDDPLLIWGTGQQRRNFLHAIDFARVFMGVTEHYSVADPVNVGYEEAVDMASLARLMCEVAGRNPKIMFDASKPEGRLVKSADSTKLQRVTRGILPTIGLRQGLEGMRKWYQKQNF